MKRPHKYWPYLIILVLGVIFSAGYLALAQEAETVVRAQEPSSDAPQVAGTSGGSVKSAVVNFSELANRESLLPAPYKEPRVVREPGRAPRNKAVAVGAGPVVMEKEQGPDAVYNPNAPLVASPAPSSTFKALEDDNASIPPDTHGAVGPNHLMVVLNTQVRIQTRTGAALSTVSLDSFWAALNPSFTFDPKVLYDPFSNRWMFTVVADAELATSSVLIAVSQTSDPTGVWKLYKLDADAANVAWADYPSIGFNKNWIVITVNMFGNTDGNFKRTNIYALDKANLYAFGAIARHKRFVEICSPSASICAFTQTPAITYDNTQNTMYLVEDWDGSTQLRIRSITGTTGANPVYSTTIVFPTVTSANSWTFSPPNGDDFAPQKGSTAKIQVNDSRIQNVVYRNGSLWATQTIFLPNSATPTRSAVQWWQLTPTGTIQQRGRIDDATAPLTFYAFPSIAVNKNNDVLIGFSRFSAQQYVSANYAFRASGDALNTLRTDFVLKAGSAPYSKDFGGGRNRWGDYSNTVVDPLNDLDMWTVQQHAAPVSGGFSRWGTWWGRVASIIPAPLIQLGTVTPVDGNTGDPDTVIEPGENGNKLTIQLKNTGKAAATAVSAQLTTSTAGVTITQSTSAYPNLAATTGAGNNTTPFTFNVASTFACGSAINFTLTVTFTGQGSPVTLSFSVPTGKPGVAVTKAYTGAAKPIPDNTTAGVNVTLAVSGFTGRIADLNFKIGGTACSTANGATTVGIDHTWVGDLVMTLKSPQGTVVSLMNQAGGVQNSGINFCNTLLDDEAASTSLIQNITPAQNPYTGTFKPNSLLSAFDGQNPNGTWTLNVSDRGAVDIGNVRAFSLIITAIECSTTALLTPVEIQSDRALAGSQDTGNQVVTPSQAISNLAPPLQTSPNLSANPLADTAAILTGAQPSGLTKEQYLKALFASIWAEPNRIEGEALRSAFSMKQRNVLMRLLAG